MYNYDGFMMEKQFKYWETLHESINENNDFTHLISLISEFLEKEIEKGSEKFTETVINILKRFKNRLALITIIVGLLLSSYMSKDSIESVLSKSGFNKTETKNIIIKAKPEIKNDINIFLNALAKSESTSDSKSINQYGYIGKYQMGPLALQDLGLDDKISTEKFKKNPRIWPEWQQDKAMIKLLKINKNYLGDYINKYEGKIVGGVKITLSGLLAGSHLCGNKSIKKFLDSNGRIIPKDGNEVPVTAYIKKFGGYKLNF